MLRYRTHLPLPGRPLGYDPPPNRAYCRSWGRSEIECDGRYRHHGLDLALSIEPHLLFRKTCAEMESGTGAALARLTVAQVQVHRGNYSKGSRSGIARLVPSASFLFGRSRSLADLIGCRRATSMASGGAL